MSSEIEQNEQQLLSLLLKHRELIEDFQESPLSVEYIDPSRRAIVHAILDSHEKDVLLTRKSFTEFLNKYVGKKQDRARLELEFNHISFKQPNRNDYPMLKEKVLNAYLLRSASSYIRDFNTEREKRGLEYAIQRLASNMVDLSNGLHDKRGKIVYDDILNLSAKHYQHILDVRADKVEDKEFISFGIEELDITSGVGLAPGTLTLFCGDVGGFKSTQMLNVASNVWWDGNHNVLFVPLEMPEDLIFYKWISRQTKVAFDLLMDPKQLSEQQIGFIDDFLHNKAPNHDARFFLMDSYEQRTSVSLIRKMIERNLEIFKPRLVVVDYIANLTPDKVINGRNDLEIGEMLKDLRYMGRPGVVHDKGFALVSGAQIGREALKRVRRSGNDNAAFHSEDLRGSHEYSADADAIYAQFPDPQQPDDRLQVFVVKSRYGKKSFSDGSRKAVFEVKPSISLIRSTADFYAGGDKNEILKKAVEDDDFSFSNKKSDKPVIDLEAELGIKPASGSDLIDTL